MWLELLLVFQVALNAKLQEMLQLCKMGAVVYESDGASANDRLIAFLSSAGIPRCSPQWHFVFMIRPASPSHAQSLVSPIVGAHLRRMVSSLALATTASVVDMVTVVVSHLLSLWLGCAYSWLYIVCSASCLVHHLRCSYDSHWCGNHQQHLITTSGIASLGLNLVNDVYCSAVFLSTGGQPCRSGFWGWVGVAT